MKKKIISLLLVFFVSLSSFKFSYADTDTNINVLELENQFNDVEPLIFDGGVISGPMLSTVATLAVGAGIVLKDDQSLYNLGSRFYDYYKDSIDTINTIFEASVVIGSANLVKVGSDFYTKVKEFLDDFVSGTNSLDYNTASSIVEVGKFTVSVPTKSQITTAGGLIRYSTGIYSTKIGDDLSNVMGNNDIVAGEIFISIRNGDRYATLGADAYLNGEIVKGWGRSVSYGAEATVYLYTYGDYKYFYVNGGQVLAYYSPSATSTVVGNVGSYDWNKVKDKIKEDDDDRVTVGVPGNVGNLVGENVDVWNPSYDLPVGGLVTFPNVANPSIELDNTTTFPLTGTNEGVGEGTDTGTGEGVGEGTGSITFPSFGDSIDFSPLASSGITEKFPFSLPWDLGRLLGIFDVQPTAPIFKFPILGQSLVIDLTIFDEWASIGRFFVSISYVVFLIFITTKLKA